MHANLLSSASLVFWDFDGVIKESLEVKTAAYVALFAAHGAQVADQVRRHHTANGGMSRFDKIPHYLALAGEKVNPELVQEYCERFGALTLRAVIDAAWVPGVEAYLRRNRYSQTFVLVSATPQEELDQIVDALALRPCFAEVHGAPTSKTDAIGAALRRFGAMPTQCLMVGDARADLLAAQAHGVPFLLRRHTTNTEVFQDYQGPSISDLSTS